MILSLVVAYTHMIDIIFIVSFYRSEINLGQTDSNKLTNDEIKLFDSRI